MKCVALFLTRLWRRCVDMTERRLTCMLCDISISNWLHNRAVGTLPMDRYEGPLISDAKVDALSSVTPILLPFIWKSFSLIPQMLCVRAYVLLSLPGSLYVVHTIRNLHLSLSLSSPPTHIFIDAAFYRLYTYRVPKNENPEITNTGVPGGTGGWDEVNCD